MERSQVAPLLKETPLSHSPAQEHLVARVACALLPTRLAAYGCPGSPKPHTMQRAPLLVPTPTGKPVVWTLGCNSGQPWMLVWLPA